MACRDVEKLLFSLLLRITLWLAVDNNSFDFTCWHHPREKKKSPEKQAKLPWKRDLKYFLKKLFFSDLILIGPQTRLPGHRPRFSNAGTLCSCFPGANVISSRYKFFKKITPPFRAKRQPGDKCQTQIVGNLWTRRGATRSLKQEETRDVACLGIWARWVLSKARRTSPSVGIQRKPYYRTRPLIRLWLLEFNHTA